MNEQDSKPYPKKLIKLNKKMKKIKTMIKELHRDRFGYLNDKVEVCEEEVDIHVSEDVELNKILVGFLDLLMEYSEALENTKINLERDTIIILGNYYNDGNTNNTQKFTSSSNKILEGEFHYEISISKDVVGFYGNVFEGINNFRIKSNIHNLYSERLIELSEKFRRQEVIKGFNKIYEISNLKRGRSMKALEDIDL